MSVLSLGQFPPHPTLPGRLKSEAVLRGGASRSSGVAPAAACPTLMLNIVTSEAVSSRRHKRAGLSILHSATSFWWEWRNAATFPASPTVQSEGRSLEAASCWARRGEGPGSEWAGCSSGDMPQQCEANLWDYWVQGRQVGTEQPGGKKGQSQHCSEPPLSPAPSPACSVNAGCSGSPSTRDGHEQVRTPRLSPLGQKKGCEEHRLHLAGLQATELASLVT